jgi:hypothetical protein
VQLELDGHLIIDQAQGLTMELPEYLQLLPDPELHVVATSPDRARLIMAAGYHPNGAQIVCMTGAGSVLELDASALKLPSGLARPGLYGASLVIVRADGTLHEASRDWVMCWARRLVDLCT